MSFEPLNRVESRRVSLARKRILRKNSTYLVFSFACDLLHREPLPSIVLDPTEENKSNRGPFSRDYFQDVFLSQNVFAFPRRYFENGCRWVQAMGNNLRYKRILPRFRLIISDSKWQNNTNLIRGESLGFTKNLEALRGRFIERIHHEM